MSDISDINSVIADDNKINFSFAGSGFLGAYYVGVMECFRKEAPHLEVNHVYGASSGALVAVCCICNISIEKSMKPILETAEAARKSMLGPLSPSFNITEHLKIGWEMLPEDAHILASGRLHISLTRLKDSKNIIISQYKTREYLIRVLMATCFIPVFSGYRPISIDGEEYIDGVFTNNLQQTENKKIIKVIPFEGEADICPQSTALFNFKLNVAQMKASMSLRNIHRTCQTLFFPPSVEEINEIKQNGYMDALMYLTKQNLRK